MIDQMAPIGKVIQGQQLLLPTGAMLSKLRREGRATMASSGICNAEGTSSMEGFTSMERRDSSRLCRCRWCRPARLPRRVRDFKEPASEPDSDAASVTVGLCICGCRCVVAPCRGTNAAA